MRNKIINILVVIGTLLTLVLFVPCQPLLAGYTDPQQRFSLEPPEGWQVQTDKSGVAIFTAPDGVTSFVIFPNVVSESESLDALPSVYEKLLKEAQPRASLKVLKETRIDIAGQPALQREYRIERGVGKRASTMVTFIKVGQLALTIAATAREKEFARFKPVFLESLQTLRFPTPGRKIAPVDLVTEGKIETVPPHVEDMVKESSFIFIGTVRKLNAATMSIVSTVDNMVIVTVDEVLKAAKTLGDYKGKEITVQLEEPGSVKMEQQMVFFTNGWLYGESIAVREVGKLPIEQEAEKLRKQVNEGIRTVADKDLQRYIASAELVVAGRVIEVKQAESAQSRRETEHDPMWQIANIEIRSVEKGGFSEKIIPVLFPSSMDVMWYKTPKFSVGQEGIWILHRDEIKELATKGYIALDPLSFHPMDQLDRIKAIIQRVR